MASNVNGRCLTAVPYVENADPVWTIEDVPHGSADTPEEELLAMA